MSTFASPGPFVAGGTDKASQQDDLAKQRSAIQDDLSRLAGPGVRFDGKDMSLADAGREAARARDELQLGGVRFEDDKISKSQPHTRGTAADFRIARVQCGECGCTTEVHQKQSIASGAWEPDLLPRLTLFGWHATGERWHCSVTCSQRHARKTKGATVVPAVTRIQDESYARRAYQEQDATTPAAPPVRTHQAPQAAPTGKPAKR